MVLTQQPEFSLLGCDAHRHRSVALSEDHQGQVMHLAAANGGHHSVVLGQVHKLLVEVHHGAVHAGVIRTSFLGCFNTLQNIFLALGAAAEHRATLDEPVNSVATGAHDSIEGINRGADHTRILFRSF